MLQLAWLTGAALLMAGRGAGFLMPLEEEGGRGCGALGGGLGRALMGGRGP